MARPTLAEQAARRALRDHWDGNLPVDERRIAAARGLTVKEVSQDSDISCCLSGNAIGVNVRHPTLRQRFAVAHALGHAILHEGDHLDRDFRVNLRDARSPRATDSDERQADAFAHELLIPAATLKERLRPALVEFDVADDGDEEVASLARAFGVSIQMVVVRLVGLGYLSLS